MGDRWAKPIRTILFVPGSEIDQVARAADHGSDAVVVDLEEPRTPFSEAQREAARVDLCAFFDALGGTGAGRPQWFVRVQPPDTGQTQKDLRAALGPALTGVMLPKITGPADVVKLDALLTCSEAEQDLEMGSTAIYPILETAQSLRVAYEIATASPRVRYLGGAVSRFGDIHRALGYRWTPEGRETLFLRSKVLIDARAAGIRYPISGMWGGALDDREGLRRWANELRDLGYYGMMLGHPDHVALVNDVFSPTPTEITYWSDLDRLAAEATEGAGPITYGDPSQGESHVVHLAHVESARLNLSWARDLGLTD